MKKTIVQKTVAQVLQSCVVGDIISDTKRTWIIHESSDELIVAYPYKWKKSWGSSFELWNCGVETLAIIPGLYKVD
jgi:hypothetical protein